MIPTEIDLKEEQIYYDNENYHLLCPDCKMPLEKYVDNILFCKYCNVLIHLENILMLLEDRLNEWVNQSILQKKA